MSDLKVHKRADTGIESGPYQVKSYREVTNDIYLEEQQHEHRKLALICLIFNKVLYAHTVQTSL